MIKKLINFILISLSLAFLATTTYAQTPAPTPAAPATQVKDLSFPIKELGNCSDYKSCLTYCDDPVNNASCIDFAKKKGFYKDDPVISKSTEVLKDAKGVLGCDNTQSCLDFCSQEANHDKCDTFAKSEKLVGGYVEQPDKPEYIAKAKEVLGCGSGGECASFCDKPENASKCSSFANQVGLLGGQTNQGPGGCSSDQTCKLYCSDPANFSTCSKAAPQGQFAGPGGCNSPDSCRNHCETNPADCRSYAPGSSGAYVPSSCPPGQFFGPGGICTSNDKTKDASACSQGGKFWNGTGCQDTPPPGISPTVGGAYFQPRPEMGNCKNPGECYDFCKSNPGKCAGFNPNSDKPKDNYVSNLYYTPGTEVKFTPKTEMGNCDSPGSCYDFCKSNPSKCQGFDSKAPRPVDVYTPLTYYTPSSTAQYFTPPATSFYTTPIYYTPPAGSNYTTPTYYTPGTYSTPSYYTPIAGSNYTTPTYYTPGTYYPTPTGGNYPTPNYVTPIYYTPPSNSNYTTPTYYTPASYSSPYYYTPPIGSTYTSPSYSYPSPYNTPSYYTPYTGGTYTTPYYYTPPAGSNYTTPTYNTPSYYYPSPSGSYSYPTPGGNYASPSSTYSTPSYSYPTPGSGYTSPSYYSPAGYPTPSGGYSYPSPGYYASPTTYPTPSYGTPSYSTPSYGTPSYSTPSYGSPSYNTPSYNTPSYETPSYNSPSYGSPSYGSPSYGTPGTYATPGSVGGVSTQRSVVDIILDFLKFK